MSGAAVPVALAAAGCFATSTSLQHHSATWAPVGGTTQLLAHLARRPLWLAGMMIAAAGLVLHAVALHLGALTLVQPLLVTGLVFALPVRAALDRRLPSRRALGWAGVTGAGVTLFLVVADPTAGQRHPDQGLAALLVGAGVLLAVAASWAGARASHTTRIGLLFGFAAGVLFGLVAGVLKMTTAAAVTGGAVGVLGSWSLYALVVLGGWGIAVNQRAYQAAPLAVSLPLLNIVDPLVAITFGAYVFDEKPADSPLAVTLEIVGLAVMAVGVVALARAETTAGGRRPRHRPTETAS